MATITESVVEQATLAWFEAMGYSVVSGVSISPNEPGALERPGRDGAVQGQDQVPDQPDGPL